MHLRPMAALLSALFIAGGCDNSLPQDIKALESDADGGPADDYEGDSAGECSDDADNDRDGLFDCEDPDCSGSEACEEDADALSTNHSLLPARWLHGHTGCQAGSV